MKIKVLRKIKYIGEDRCCNNSRYMEFYKKWDKNKCSIYDLDFTQTDSHVKHMIVTDTKIEISLEDKKYTNLCDFFNECDYLIANGWILGD